jgi:hypothetical protein
VEFKQIEPVPTLDIFPTQHRSQGENSNPQFRLIEGSYLQDTVFIDQKCVDSLTKSAIDQFDLAVVLKVRVPIYRRRILLYLVAGWNNFLKFKRYKQFKQYRS